LKHKQYQINVRNKPILLGVLACLSFVLANEADFEKVNNN